MAEILKINGLAIANVKSVKGLAVANCKSWNGLAFPSGVDADATTFINACAAAGHALTADEQTYINTLVVALKGHSLWTKFYAIYPMIGGDVATVVINLKNPGTYNLTLVGSPTVSDNGIDWNGSSQYAKTGIVPSSVMSLNDCHISFYSREDNDGAYVDMGCSDNYSGGTNALMAFNVDDTTSYNRVNSTTANNAAATRKDGLFTQTRRGASEVEYYRNSLSLLSDTTASTALAGYQIYLAAYNGAGTVGLYSPRQQAWASVGTGLTDGNVSDLYTDVQAFQTSLGRNV